MGVCAPAEDEDHKPAADEDSQDPMHIEDEQSELDPLEIQDMIQACDIDQPDETVVDSSDSSSDISAVAPPPESVGPLVQIPDQPPPTWINDNDPQLPDLDEIPFHPR